MLTQGLRAILSLPALVHCIRGGCLDGQPQVLRVGCTEGQGVTLTGQGNQDQAGFLSSSNHIPLLVDYKPKPAIFKTQVMHGPP